MKILWVTSNFLHPTTKGGQIRTLEMLKHLHQRHEIHFAAFENPDEPEGPLRSGEYSTRAFSFRLRVPPHGSAGFVWQLVRGLFARWPVAVSRFYSRQAHDFLAELMRRENYDRLVCDFLTPAAYFPAIERAVLFQHNVETIIWRRRVEHAGDPLSRWYLGLQARRMFAFERDVCRAAGRIAAVSETDARLMRELFGATRVDVIPTGVDADYFSPPHAPPAVADLVFVGSMDWAPNVDGIGYFMREVLPLIQAERPSCTVAVVGRTPPAEVQQLAAQDKRVLVTGTVPDVRPYLWGSRVAIVPLRIGGGTRLKIYEAMAAQIPVVSTAIGAEGLQVESGRHLLLADTPEAFARQCLALLDDAPAARLMAEQARRLVTASFSWTEVVRRFERILEQAPEGTPRKAPA